MQETFICDLCQQEHPLSELTEFDGQNLCSSCFGNETVVCDHCGTRVWREDAHISPEIILCERCLDHYYTTCDRCGRLIPEQDAFYPEDNDDTLCGECYNAYVSSHSIHDYYFKPDPIFYGEGDRYFGVELEIDGAGERNDHAQCILDQANLEEERIYCKHDGSLDDGFEIVTHPMTLDYHLHHMPWAAVVREAANLGYTSHQARTCGLHVHVNRSCFGATDAEQEAAIARVLYFFEKHWEELLKFSRRTQNQLKRWAARYGYREQPREILDHAKKGSSGRYTCVNLSNVDTVEFRMFRGTLKLNTLTATLQMVDRICDVAIYLSDEELTSMAWTTFVSGIDAGLYPELVQYLKERRLYINDAVSAGGEI